MQEKNGKEKMKKRLVLTLFSFALILSTFNFISSESTSIYQTQYFPPTTTSFGSYSSLMSGPSTRQSTIAGNDNEFFDMELFIPPLGCQPYVVRSDLLEEQNVPVFCNLVPLKINPGIDITRINSISIVKKENNPYVAGVGFHPANAAIKSSSGNGAPSGDSIGYVVVVLKQQDAEKNMPANITITLAARVDYGAENSFGIGKNEFYIPELTEDEFRNDYSDYSFYDGVGYLRAENINDKSAKIIIYDSGSNIIFSDTIEKGKTSRDFYLANGKGGQGVRITLKDITLPQKKAQIRVNDQKFEVYEGQEFYDGKCRLASIQSLGLGAGTATITCNSKPITLDKQINKVSLQVFGEPKDASLDELVSPRSGTTSKLNDYYLVLANKIKNSEETYVVLAKINLDLENSIGLVNMKNVLAKLSSAVGRAVDGKSLSEVKAILEIKVDGKIIPISFIVEGDKADTDSGITFAGLKTQNAVIDEKVKPYYENAMSAYDYIKDSFGVEMFPSVTTIKPTYSEESLWREYDLAKALEQQEKQKEVLSRILNEYPNSVHKSESARSLIDSMGLLANNAAASYYDATNDMTVELISINEPSPADRSVDLSYDVGGKLEVKSGMMPGETIFNDPSKTITLESFD